MHCPLPGSIRNLRAGALGAELGEAQERFDKRHTDVERLLNVRDDCSLKITFILCAETLQK